MEKYIEETTAEEVKKNLVTDAIVSKTGADPEVIKNMSDEDRDTLAVAVSTMEESLFDNIWDDEMSLLENISFVVKEMTLKEAADSEIIDTIVKFSGMKIEEATEAFESVRA